MRNVSIYAALVSLVMGIGCSGSKNGHGGGPDRADAACGAARAHVEAVYRAERPGDGDAEARAVADNTEMALWDCRRAPARLAPCLQSASSVAQLERDCLLPLDDEGEAEAKLFREK